MMINLRPGGEPPRQPEPKCDRCDRRATVYGCSIKHGVKTQSQLCDQHANEEMDGATFDTPATCRQIAGDLHAMAAFMRSHGHMPASGEPTASPAAAGAADPELLKQAAYIERTADFIETHGRPPYQGELPPDPSE